MELNNLPSASYILPLDSIDLDMLSARRIQVDSNGTAPIPIWTANRLTDQYYEFQVYAESLGDTEIECKENQTKQLCHICKIEIPTAYLKEHIGSDMHKTFLKILENSMDRLKMHATNEIQSITETSHSDSYFCPYCCDAVKMVDKDVHDVSKKHEIAYKYYETIKSLQNSYEDIENFTKNINFVFDNEDDSTSLSLDENTLKKKKRNRKVKSVAHNDEEINDNSNKILTISDESTKTSIVGPKLDISIEKKAKIETNDDENNEEVKSTVIVHEPNTGTMKTGIITSNTENVAIERYQDQNKLMVALNVNANKDVDEPKFDRKIGMETYLQGIKLENASLAIGVTITFNEGCKVSVSMDNFHGLYRVAGHVQCRLCRVLVLDEEQHVTGGIHMQYVQRDIADEHCIRQLNQTWSHCIICNEHVECKDAHILTSNHIYRLNKAIIIKNTNDTIKKTESFSQTTLNYCNVCNIVMPLTKEARKKHRSSKEHRDKALSYSEANKRDNIALQTTAAPGIKLVVNSANKVEESQNRDAQTKFYASVKPSTSKHVMTTNTNETPNHNAIRVQNVIDRTNKKTICRICKVEIPNCNTNIKDHLKGKLHLSNLRAAKAEEISKKSNSKELINCEKIKLETLLATPSSSKQEIKIDFNNLNVNHTPSITKAVPEIKTNNVKNIPVTTIEIIDNEAFCHACQTKVPNSNTNIKDHLSGKRHTSNLAQMFSRNRIVIQNGEYFCEACSTKVLKVNVLKHLKTSGHQNVILTQESEKDRPNTVKNSQEIKPHQICGNLVETNSSNSTDNINISTSHNKIICFICKFHVKNNEAAKKAHKDGIMHLSNVHKAFQNKSEASNDIEANIKKMICVICSSAVKIGHMMAHILKDHAEFSDSLLDDGLKSIVYSVENNSYHCKFCNCPPFSGKFRALVHILGDKHLRVFIKLNASEDNTESIQSLSTPHQSNPTNNTLQKTLQVNDITKTNKNLIHVPENITIATQETYKSDEPMFASAEAKYYTDYALENSVGNKVKDIESNPQRSVLVEASQLTQLRQNLLETPDIAKSKDTPNQNVIPVNIKQISCNFCVIKSRNSPSDIHSRLIELSEASKKKHGDENIMELCTSCESIFNKVCAKGFGESTNEVNDSLFNDCKQKNKTAVCKPDKMGASSPKDETKSAESSTNQNESADASALDDWFDAEDLTGASAENSLGNHVIPNCCQVDHMNSETHERNLKTLPEVNMKYHFLDSIKPEDVAISQNDLVITENEAYYCKFCNVYIDAKNNNVTSHINLKCHLRNLENILTLNDINVISGRYYCLICEKHFDDKFFDHISTLTHKSNNTNITYVGSENNETAANTSGPNKTEEKSKEASPKMMKTLKSILSIKDKRLFCGVCKLQFDAVLNGTTKHLNSKTHTFMFEAMLSANGITDLIDSDYFCQICKVEIPANLLMKHISHVAHNAILIDELKARGKLILAAKCFTTPCSFIQDNNENSKTILEIMKMVATCPYGEEYVCALCDVSMPFKMQLIQRHESNPEHLNNFTKCLQQNGISVKGEVCYCKVCNSYFTRNETMGHLISQRHRIRVIRN